MLALRDSGSWQEDGLGSSVPAAQPQETLLIVVSRSMRSESSLLWKICDGKISIMESSKDPPSRGSVFRLLLSCISDSGHQRAHCPRLRLRTRLALLYVDISRFHLELQGSPSTRRRTCPIQRLPYSMCTSFLFSQHSSTSETRKGGMAPTTQRRGCVTVGLQ